MVFARSESFPGLNRVSSHQVFQSRALEGAPVASLDRIEQLFSLQGLKIVVLLVERK